MEFFKTKSMTKRDTGFKMLPDISIYKQLHDYIIEGQIEKVDDYINFGADINFVLEGKGTALITAVVSNQIQVAQYLIQKDCDINTPGQDGVPPLCLALKKGHMDMMAVLVKGGCRVNVVDPNTKMAPLCLAIKLGNFNAVKLLVRSGCDVNQCDGYGNTPVHLAVTYNYIKILRMLLKQGCNLNIFNMNDKAPLHLATDLGNVAAIKNMVLASTGKIAFEAQLSDLSLRDHDNASHACNQMVRSGRTCVTSCDLDLQTQLGNETALHIAVRLNHVQLTKFFLRSGASANITNTINQTPLYKACLGGHIEVARALLDGGADLHHLPDKLSDTRSISTNISAWSTNRNRNSTLIHVAIVQSNLEMVKLLVEYGVDLNDQDESGETALSYAITSGNVDIVQFLISEVSETGIDVTSTDNNRNNPLHLLSYCKDPDNLVQTLINLGCDINAQNADGNTPLHCAILGEHSTLVELLLDNDPDMSLLNQNGLGPAHLCVAKFYQDVKVLISLLSHGADVNSKTIDGRSILDVALETNNTKASMFLALQYVNVSRESLAMVDCSNKVLHNMLFQLIDQPKPLLCLSRTIIREHFQKFKLSFKDMSYLLIPRTLISFLEMKIF
ncbi:unnamed protein product [Owenia fusiformis]|uniref:Uncharacterized protein n=1 Tax=Owenia fusiformis TaxID=6347 RepID=A0A8S4PVZ8_OWEFU|nr:unnamed protein product [Owenia fusiformis]